MTFFNTLTSVCIFLVCIFFYGSMDEQYCYSINQPKRTEVQRKRSHYSKGCEFFIYIAWDRMTQCYRLKTHNLKHNHAYGPDVYPLYALRQREQSSLKRSEIWLTVLIWCQFHKINVHFIPPFENCCSHVHNDVLNTKMNRNEFKSCKDQTSRIKKQQILNCNVTFYFKWIVQTITFTLWDKNQLKCNGLFYRFEIKCNITI